MTEADPLVVAVARKAIGDLPSEDLPQVAADALVRGLDSPSLRALAGQQRHDVRDSADLLQAVVGELGIDIPDVESAHWFLVKRAAADIVAGRVDPLDGAQQIDKSYYEVQDSGDLRIFHGLLSQYDDWPEEADQTKSQIIAEAREFLSRPGPRRWIRLQASTSQAVLNQTANCDDLEIDPADLLGSTPLLTDIIRWESDFHEILTGWPRRGGFKSIAEADQFVERGASLAEDLQDALGDTVHVEYYPEPVRPPGVKLRRSRFLRRRR